jgi:hypothetical protein
MAEHTELEVERNREASGNATPITAADVVRPWRFRARVPRSSAKTMSPTTTSGPSRDGL